MAGPSDATPVVEAQKRAPVELKAVADFLRGKNGPKIRRGVLNGKRVDYFKGKTAIRVLTGPAYLKTKKVPEIADEKAAEELLGKVLPNAFFLRVDRPTPSPAPPAGTPKTLLLSPQQHFTADAYYAWFYDGSPLTTYLGAAAMVIVIFAGVLFPLWPATLRLGVWYLSILALGAIGALIALAIVRLIFWCITVVATKRAIWMFPNLFEDVGFIDSFIPVWAYDEPKKKKKRAIPGGSSSSGGKKRSAAGGVNGITPGPMHIAGGDLMGAQPAQAEMKPIVGDAAGAGSAAGGAGAKAKVSGVQMNGGGEVRHRQQATVEEIEE
ncbi:putative endoplasmic reticulum receptor [Dioszegia hungarica]|uniref:Translocation protein SEC62 n=1 Tax=Dioszegia hungarica TaxID=4972 RepID=A0AA38HEH9_9TREE|nr:putative endoplasmic reticulum receptor [Dioszegia hungarica]KAI9638647.1 putative endoplasmic reticulum receptor [Dioszegia hungarica]